MVSMKVVILCLVLSYLQIYNTKMKMGDGSGKFGFMKSMLDFSREHGTIYHMHDPSRRMGTYFLFLPQTTVAGSTKHNMLVLIVDGTGERPRPTWVWGPYPQKMIKQKSVWFSSFYLELKLLAQQIFNVPWHIINHESGDGLGPLRGLKILDKPTRNDCWQKSDPREEQLDRIAPQRSPMLLCERFALVLQDVIGP